MKRLINYLLISVLLGASTHCADRKQASEKSQKPDPTRFTYQVVAEGLNEPMQLEFDKQGRVYWIERTGAVKRADEATGQVTELGRVKLTEQRAPGLIGLLLDKDFEQSQQLYLYYSAADDNGTYMRLSRFTLSSSGNIDETSEKVLLKVFWEQPDGEHFGGGMTWDTHGNLFLSIGCDSAPTQYAPYAFTNEGGRGQDSGRSAGNTNDLRGSIIRIRPERDGTYSIPPGNLFPEGTPQTLPEIYVMGNRNPWRLSVDSKTGYLHWGEVGPDAGVDSEKQGPMGYDEFNIAREAGNFGWPFVVGKNLAYKSYNYETGLYGVYFNPQAPVNSSPNNTGLDTLPPAVPALVAYPYRVSEDWPVLRSAARSAVGGPVFRKADFSVNAAGVFPDYYEGKWLVTDYVRNWIMLITMNEDQTEATSIEPFLPAEQLEHKQPLDMDFGPSGDLYIVEYGLEGQGRISKVVYNPGNRAPIASASAKPAEGALPLQVELSSEGSVDYDGDNLSFQWTITPVLGGEETMNFSEPKPKPRFQRPGKYEATLTVRDPAGESDFATIEIIAGNERPDVQFQITSGNRSFYFPNHAVAYQVAVSDAEDGSLLENGIATGAVSVTAEYIPAGMSREQLNLLTANRQLKTGTALRFLNAQALIEQYNCMTCHKLDDPLLGPAYVDVATKYKGDKLVFEKLHKSITEGSSGKWGEAIMPPHPMLSTAETAQIIDYIMSLASPDKGIRQLDIAGTFSTKGFPLRGDVSRLGKFYKFSYEPGAYVFRASYTDKGVEGVAGLNLAGEDIVLLRYPLLSPESADFFSESGISFTPSTDDPGFIFTGQGGHIGFKKIDLSGIKTINIGAVTRFWHWSHFIGATVELRLGSPEGTLVGEPFTIVPPPTREGDGPFFGEAAGKPVPVDVSAVDGLHDVFIIVRNEAAKESDALLIMTGIEFLQ